MNVTMERQIAPTLPSLLFAYPTHLSTQLLT